MLLKSINNNWIKKYVMSGTPDTNSISDCWLYDATVFCISESTMRSQQYVCFEIILKIQTLRRYNQSITYHPLVTNDQSEPICIQ